jgi:hypothetical protein
MKTSGAPMKTSGARTKSSVQVMKKSPAVMMGKAAVGAPRALSIFHADAGASPPALPAGAA